MTTSFMRATAKRLRREMTDAERCLWYHLQDRRLAGFKFRRQHVIGRHIVDFVCLEAGLVIEADGGQHIDRESDDRERTNELRTRGYRVLRFWNHEILAETDAVLERIHAELCGE